MLVNTCIPQEMLHFFTATGKYLKVQPLCPIFQARLGDMGEHVSLIILPSSHVRPILGLIVKNSP